MGASVAKDVKTSKARPKRASAAARDMASSEMIARKLAKVAPDEDPAHVAGAIAIFATETIKRSAQQISKRRAPTSTGCGPGSTAS